MAQFEVTSTDQSGKTVKNFVEADSVKTARARVRSQGLIPISVRATDGAEGKKAQESFSAQMKSPLGGVSTEDVTNMTRQLATLVKAHVPIVESLSAMVEQIDSPKLRPVLMSIRQNVKEGKSLGDSFQAFPKIFNRVYVNMVRAGESSGRLDVVLLRLADFGEAQVKLKNKIVSAMTYPLVMLVVGTLIVAVILAKVVPEITKIFADTGQALPTPTVVLMGASAFVQNYGLFMLIGFIALAIMAERYISTPAGRARKDRFLLKAPIFKIVTRNLAVARFARTLGTLLQSGVPMLGALEITKNVVSNAVFEEVIANAAIAVSEGKSLAYSIKQSREFPPIVVHMIGTGEKSGELEQMLVSVADNYEQQVETSLGRLTSLLEPLMIILMASVVGFIVMAILLPIFDMQNIN